MSELEKFLGEGPWYILVDDMRPDPVDPVNVVFVNPAIVKMASAPDAIAVFTDKAAAEQFCDEEAPEKKLVEIPVLILLKIAIHGLAARATHVVRDPYRPGYQSIHAPIEFLLEGFPGEPH